MKRLKVMFSIVLLLIAMPLWRYMDFITLIWAGELLYSMTFFLWGLVFLVLPAWLLKPKLVPAIVLAFVLVGTLANYNLGPLSDTPTDDPSATHCGRLTFTGLFYPALDLMTQAPADDIEARNQLCWVKKMIQQVPKFNDHKELDAYLKLAQEKLLVPENKFRVALPMIALLYGVIFAHHEGVDPNPENGKAFIDNLKFWIGQYTVEISSRSYSWWDIPYGPYIQLEYGIVERNWEKIVNSLIIEE